MQYFICCKKSFICSFKSSVSPTQGVALPNPTPACQKARTFEPSGGANCDFDYLKLGKFLSSSLQNTPAEVFVRESILQDGSMDDMLRVRPHPKMMNCFGAFRVALVRSMC